jgi:hypothetical protein
MINQVGHIRHQIVHTKGVFYSIMTDGLTRTSQIWYKDFAPSLKKVLHRLPSKATCHTGAVN